MKRGLSIRLFIGMVLTILLFACSNGQDFSQMQNQSNENVLTDINYLALGDSYTIGESVVYDQNYPSQLKQRLETELGKTIGLEIIAVTGWRTDELLQAVNRSTGRASHDFITLLIGVNNQFQNRPISQFENELELLISKALDLAENNNERVMVISIPDYGYTPFGENRDMEKISKEIDEYNEIIKSLANEKGVQYVNITDISRRGLNEPELVANDGLHLSGIAYAEFVDRLFPKILPELKD